MSSVHATPDAAIFWGGCSEGVFSLQRCSDCASWRFPPGPSCPECGSVKASWETASGQATLISYAVYQHDFGASLELPYVVVLVRLREGPHMISRLVDCQPEDVSIGMELTLEFREGPDQLHLPLFKPRPVTPTNRV